MNDRIGEGGGIGQTMEGDGKAGPLRHLGSIPYTPGAGSAGEDA